MRSLLRLNFTLLTLAVFSTPAFAGMFSHQTMINGAGATFPYPLYSKWFAEFQKLEPKLAFNYQSIGSGGGIRQLLDETVDFGASDIPMTDDQLKVAKRPVLHVPATMGAVVVSYNLPGMPADAQLKLNGKILGDIFLGKIKSWDDEAILALNPKLKPVLDHLVKKDILVIHRADGSGTTAVFSEYLSKVSPDWKAKVGSGTALRWPMGIGGKGNEGVSSFVKQIPGSIGYVELVFAKVIQLPFASLENPKHEFITPSTQSVTAAADGMAAKIPADFRTSLTWVDAAGAYPISSFSYILIYESGAHNADILKFLDWALHAGQAMGERMNYAALPPSLIAREMKLLEKVKSLGATAP